MNNKALAITHVREMREQLHVLDELLARLAPALNAKGEDRPWPHGKILFAELVVRALRKARIIHPSNRLMVLEILGHLAGVRDMALHPHVKSLETLQQQEGVEWALA